MSPNETILITGATGFIGGWLVETLYLTGAAHPRAGIRSWSRAARLGRFPVDIVPCDVLDERQITQALLGVPIVVHCAIGRGDVIVQGTRNMLEVARKLDVKRFVHLSTTEIYGNVSGEIDESCPYHPTGQEYGDAKIEAEQLVWEYYKRGLPVTVLRPPIVYGPFGKDFTLRLAHRLESRNWGLFAGFGEGLCNLLYVTDLVSAILLAARHESAIGEAFNINGQETITWNQYFQRFNAALGLPELAKISLTRTKVRAMLMDAARSSAKGILRGFEGPIKSLYKRHRTVRSGAIRFEKSIITNPRLAELRLYNRGARYLATKAQKMLGCTPKVDVNTGLQMSANWIHHLGVEAFM